MSVRKRIPATTLPLQQISQASGRRIGEMVVIEGYCRVRLHFRFDEGMMLSQNLARLSLEENTKRKEQRNCSDGCLEWQWPLLL